MATQKRERILRLGIIQNGRIIEERLVRERKPVKVGQTLKNDFVIASGEFPQSHILFGVKGGRYVLNFTEKMAGRLALGDAVHDLNSLKQTGKARRSGGSWELDLSDRSRGKVSLGDVTILFQFVNPPPLRVLPQLPANMRGGILLFMASVMGLSGVLLATLTFSAILQIGFVTYVRYFVPPPPRPTLADISARIIRPPAPIEEEPDVEDVDLTEDGDIVVDNAETDEGAEDDSGAVEQDSGGGASDGEIREVSERVVQESALSSLLGADGGIDLGITTTDQMAANRAEEALANQQARGAVGDGIVSSAGLGTSQGAEGRQGRHGVGTGGSTVAATAEVAQAAESEQVRVTANVRGSSARTAGSGSLDNSAVNRVLRRRSRDVERCYERGLNSNPGLGGRVVVQFTIGTDGRVSNARLPTNEVGSSVGNCILGRVRRWRFPEPDGGTVTVRKAYVLSPGS